MSFADLYKRTKPPSLTPKERKTTQLLVVEPEGAVRMAYRSLLSALGFPIISEAQDHLSALQRIQEDHFTHVIFDCKKSSIPSREFVQKLIELDPKIIAIASSFEPSVDDVFDLLVAGARGYIVKPFTQDSLDEAFVTATKGEAISRSILDAGDRNEALSSFIVSALDALAVVLRQSQKFESALAEIPRRKAGLKRACTVGLHFAKNGEVALRDSLIELCLQRGAGPASKLGRTRKRLHRAHAQTDASQKDEPE